MKVLCSLFSVSIGNHSSDYEQAVALSVYSEVRSVIVSSFIKNVHQFIMYPARPFCLLADGLTVKSFFSSRKAQINSFRFYTKLLKTLKLMLSNAVFLFKTISSCKKNFHRLFYRTTQFTRGGSGQAGCLSSQYYPTAAGRVTGNCLHNNNCYNCPEFAAT